MSDVAMDPYSSDGHDGVVQSGQIVNDLTLPILADMAVVQAEAGFDSIGPSDMMDGRVGVIRDAPDAAGHTDTGILSYTAKYATVLRPFRDALESAPKHGDKKTYQMDPANRGALREADLDMAEGADMLMVKPALCYLDVIMALKEYSDRPIAAYNVSGEYAMLKAAAEKGWIDYDKAMPEMLLSIHRAGADVILTYFARNMPKCTRHGEDDFSRIRDGSLLSLFASMLHKPKCQTFGWTSGMERATSHASPALPWTPTTPTSWLRVAFWTTSTTRRMLARPGKRTN